MIKSGFKLLLKYNGNLFSAGFRYIGYPVYVLFNNKKEIGIIKGKLILFPLFDTVEPFEEPF